MERLTSVAASPDGMFLAGGGVSGTLYIWETASGRLLRSWPAHYKVGSQLLLGQMLMPGL
jgi:pre-rRNA-processing protein IPI3